MHMLSRLTNDEKFVLAILPFVGLWAFWLASIALKCEELVQ